MAKSPEEFAHLEWLGYVQPVGLVVSIPALLAAQAHVPRSVVEEHRDFLATLPTDAAGEIVPEIRDLPAFTRNVLGWEAADLERLPDARLPDELLPLQVLVREYDETLRPTYVVRELDPGDDGSPWLMLVHEVPPGTDLDDLAESDGRHWNASPQDKFERLLRETEVPIGLLSNGTQLRLVYAPRGETSGHATFSVTEMVQVSGRPIFAALCCLLSAERLFTLPAKQRLPHVLSESRKYQNTVSTKLAEQVLAALYELLRGFQSADDQTNGELLREVLADDPDEVYHGLLVVLMRLVFVLFAEDRGLMPTDPLYTNHHAVSGLFDRLRAEAGRHPDTMDQRYGAWAQLLVLFRLIHEGARDGDFHVPPRKGYLFDPHRYPFLEGRPHRSTSTDCPLDLPRVPDGVVHRVLRNLLVLDGERLSYRTLDVEQIGSVYETIMGFRLEIATGPGIAIKPAKRHGAPATINLEELLAEKPAGRGKWFKEHTDRKLTGKTLKALKEAETTDDLLAALDRNIANAVTPHPVRAGAMIFQPSDERRRSGSHYTPRSLTEPIVRKTLEPILDRLRDWDEPPVPEDILGLKVCDPAMGSGAFLVETCRQLGDELVASWHAHDRVPPIPADEDELLHARRLVAQRCLYGVDKNPMATDLAKLSLWLVTLAKDHPFTFLDHALRTGDSLVGLTRAQIEGFHWEPDQQIEFDQVRIRERIDTASRYRREILHAREDVPYRDQESRLALADESLSAIRLVGDTVVAAFFAAKKKRARQQKRDELFTACSEWMAASLSPLHREPITEAVRELRSGEHPVEPFHWEIEFPEVFDRENGGFDAFVGNPPFAGKNSISSGTRIGYLDWLKTLHKKSHGNADLVAHFFRRAFNAVRSGGTVGLISTNTIAQGDTRTTGLTWICSNGGIIYSARRRVGWPGVAAVVVSIVHISKSTTIAIHPVLDGTCVARITAFLFSRGGSRTPSVLCRNAGLSFQGTTVLGMGFTFDDSSVAGSSLESMRDIVRRNPACADRIFPYLGGEEVNSSPLHEHHRYVINFGHESANTAQTQWPELWEVVEQRVKGTRGAHSTGPWWQFERHRDELYAAIGELPRVLVCPQTSNVQALAFVAREQVFAHTLVVFALSDSASFAILQSRLHQCWSAFLGPTMKDDLRYTPTDCFETFPRPVERSCHRALSEVGDSYYEHRAELMIANDEGLTKTYNRFHDPDERSEGIVRLRELHDAMDRVVLEAYGWDDLAEAAACEFLLDYEEPEDDEPGRKRRKKKPWRYRWPDDFRDEVLARLLELNQQRAEEERLAGETSGGGNV